LPSVVICPSSTSSNRWTCNRCAFRRWLRAFHQPN